MRRTPGHRLVQEEKHIGDIFSLSLGLAYHEPYLMIDVGVAVGQVADK